MGAEKQADPTDELPFEEALERLEQIVDQLDQTDLELEAALDAFEQGVRLSARCAAQLDAAEGRIEILMEEGGRRVTRPFEPASDGDSREED